MKKLNLILLLLTIFFSLKSQPSSTNFSLVVDFNHYTVNQSTHDSVFVKYIQFDLSDTSSVSKINYTLSEIISGNQSQQDYNFPDLLTVQDLTIANNGVRNRKKIKISLGYFKYEEKNYLITIKLYDKSNNLLSSTDFNFSH